MTQKANSEAIDDIQDMHRGLHIAMDHLINRSDTAKAEEVLRQIDLRMSRWINDTKKI